MAGEIARFHQFQGSAWISPEQAAHFALGTSFSHCLDCRKGRQHSPGIAELIDRFRAEAVADERRTFQPGTYSAEEVIEALHDWRIEVPIQIESGFPPVEGPGSAADPWPALARRMLRELPTDEKLTGPYVEGHLRGLKVGGKNVTSDQAKAIRILYAAPAWRSTRTSKKRGKTTSAVLRPPSPPQSRS